MNEEQHCIVGWKNNYIMRINTNDLIFNLTYISSSNAERNTTTSNAEVVIAVDAVNAL
jgi:hypothetical protein